MNRAATIDSTILEYLRGLINPEGRDGTSLSKWIAAPLICYSVKISEGVSRILAASVNGVHHKALGIQSRLSSKENGNVILVSSKLIYGVLSLLSLDVGVHSVTTTTTAKQRDFPRDMVRGLTAGNELTKDGSNQLDWQQIDGRCQARPGLGAGLDGPYRDTWAGHCISSTSQ